MKAKYKAGRPEDNLTVGKKYDVEDVRCKKGFEASEVYLKNDKQQKCWYSVELFTMYAESALCMAAAKGSCVFGSDFVPECCIDSPKAETHEDCCACVLQNVAFAEYD